MGFGWGDDLFEFQNRVDEVTPEEHLSMPKAWWGWEALSCVILFRGHKNWFVNQRILSPGNDARKSKS
jgi:hypothetical protein